MGVAADNLVFDKTFQFASLHMTMNRELISEVGGEKGGPEGWGGRNGTKSERLLFLVHVLYRALGRTFE